MGERNLGRVRGEPWKVIGPAYPTVGALEAAVPDPNAGDQYNVGSGPPYNVYRWNGTEWEDQGIIQGSKGDPGNDGYSPTANVHKVGKTATITITDKDGTTNAEVNDGKAFTILGQYATLSALQAAVPNPAIGDQYYVGDTPPRNVYRWDGTAWIDDGKIEGAPGADGADGADGQNGMGVPTGGATGQMLVKASGTDYDTAWADAPAAADHTGTLTAEDWDGASAPYTQSVSVTGLMAGAKLFVGLGALTGGSEAAQYAAAAEAMLMATAQAAGSVTVTAFGTKPEIDLPVLIREVA